MQCKATTKQNRRCHNLAQKDKVAKNDLIEPLTTGVGVILGNIILPGIGGILAGSIIGNTIGRKLGEDNMAKKRVFVSFDFENDRTLKDFIIGQSKLPDSPFEVIDHSLKEAAPEHNWETKANNAIRRSDIVIVMVGPYTHKAQGVIKEVRMARAVPKKIVQVIGYKDGNYTAVPDAGRLYAWNWENLKKLLT